MTLFNFNLPLNLPLEPAVDAVSDYSPAPAPPSRGKGAKDRVVYLSHDAQHALVEYLKIRFFLRVKHLFLVDKGRCKGNPLSVRAIQKRMEYYARKAGLKVSCHQLRHTMAT